MPKRNLFQVAIRNLLRNRRRTAQILLVIAVGVAALLFAGGYAHYVFEGLRESTIHGQVGHLQIVHPDAIASEEETPLEHGLERQAEVRALVEQDRDVAVTLARVELTGLLSNGRKSEAVMGLAVEPELERRLRIWSGNPRPEPSLLAGEPEGIELGEKLADALQAKPGDYLTLLSTTQDGAINAVDVKVAGTFTTGNAEGDRRFFRVPLSLGQGLLRTERVSSVIVVLRETTLTDRAATRLERRLADAGRPVAIRHWYDLADFYRSVRGFFVAVFGFLGIVIAAVVVLGISESLLMSVFERVREIGALMAIGTSRRTLLGLFVAEGLVLGIAGGLLGVVLGAGLGWLVNHSGIMMPPPPGRNTGYALHVDFVPQVAAFALCLTAAIAGVASFFPALKAARMRIVEALGHV